ncbi:MAG: sigma factor for late transcription [Nitrososphaerales archaeon]
MARNNTKLEYVNNESLLAAMLEYKNKVAAATDSDKSARKVLNYIGECFMKIATNLAKRPNFCMYSYKDEMILDGIENCIMYFSNFDPKKSTNAFAYFTQICWYAFIRRIAKEKKQQYVKCKATENFGIFDEDELNELSALQNQFQIYDNLYEFVGKYEETINKDKKQTSKRKRGIEKFLE